MAAVKQTPFARGVQTIELEENMKILGMGLPELLIILGVAILIFGPKQLPKLGSALGKTVKNLREGLGDSNKADDEVEALEEAPKAKPAPKKAAAETE